MAEVGMQLVARGDTTLAELHRGVGEQGLEVSSARVTRGTRVGDRIDIARTDPLSGLLDRFALTQRFHDWHETREKEGLSLLSQTIDQLADVNVRLGVDAGDHLIRGVSGALREAFAAEDESIALGRWRAGELVALFPGRDPHAVRALVSRACVALEQRSAKDVPLVTISGAVVAWTAQINIRELLALADPLWRRVVERGGNDIQVALRAE